MTLNPMQLVRDYYSQAQDVLSDNTKDRLINVSRQSGTTGRHINGDREEQVRQGQQDFLDIRDPNARRNAVDIDLDTHLYQQQQLRKLR